MNLRKRFLLIKDKMGHTKKMISKSATYTHHTTEMRCGKILESKTEGQRDMMIKLHQKTCEKCKNGIVLKEHEYEKINTVR